MKILVRRQGALGDVLETTPIIRRLRRENPDALIDVETDYQAIFFGNTDINHPIRLPHVKYDREIDLNMAFENQLRQLHPTDAYSEVAFGDRGTPHELHYIWQHVDIEGDRPIVIHAAKSWPIRTLPIEFWQALIDILRARGREVILTGTNQDWNGLRDCADSRGKVPLAGQVGLIDAADCFICSESGPMIMAQVTRTPIIALTTMIDPKHIMHLRHGAASWRFHTISANVPCVGCALDQSEAVTYFDCRLGTRACVSAFDPQAIANLVEKVAIPRGAER